MLKLIRAIWRAVASRRSHQLLNALNTIAAREVCAVPCDAYGFSCTRETGHLGPHVATTQNALIVCINQHPERHWCGLQVPPEIVYAMNQALELHLALAGDTIEILVHRQT